MSTMADSATSAHRPVLTAREGEFAIYDNFLSQAEFAALGSYANSSEYRHVHNEGVRKVWRLHDGSPLQGETTFLGADLAPGRLSAAYAQKPIHRFLARLNDTVDVNARLVGERSSGWKRVSAAPWVYPAGTALSLHADNGRYSGSYTFFVHPRWGLHWGGYLLILNPSKYFEQQAMPDTNGFGHWWLSDDMETDAFEDPGVAVAILPRPNRLVLIAPHAYHMVTRVDANAGQNPRVSIAGFFQID